MRIFLLLLLVVTNLMVLANRKITIDEYINHWSPIAVAQMHEHQIPASIKMAQGILESSFGNSQLALEANNHFGIKCHDWSGPAVYKDDDAKNECFRKYHNPEESFNDHSLFLVNRSRYAQLFELEITDYQGWARGLRKAGYATNPKYADLLIDLIERHELYNLDLQQLPMLEPTQQLALVSKPGVQEVLQVKNTRSVAYNSNKTKYVLAKDGDTFFQLAQEFNLTLRQLHKYNDFPPQKDILNAGDLVYLMPKPKRAKKHLAKVDIEEEKNLYEISQYYGVRLKSLMAINQVDNPQRKFSKGEVIALR